MQTGVSEQSLEWMINNGGGGDNVTILWETTVNQTSPREAGRFIWFKLYIDCRVTLVTSFGFVLGKPFSFAKSHFHFCSHVTCQTRSKCFTLILDDITKTHWHLILIVLCDSIAAHLVSQLLDVPGIFLRSLKIICVVITPDTNCSFTALFCVACGCPLLSSTSPTLQLTAASNVGPASVQLAKLQAAYPRCTLHHTVRLTDHLKIV